MTIVVNGVIQNQLVQLSLIFMMVILIDLDSTAIIPNRLPFLVLFNMPYSSIKAAYFTRISGNITSHLIIIKTGFWNCAFHGALHYWVA
jgi:hypothetical protein